MKNLFMVLCILIMFFGIVGCPSDDPETLSKSSFTSKSVTTPSTVSEPIGDDTSGVPGASPVPEPTTLILLGSGLFGVVGWGRKRFRK